MLIVTSAAWGFTSLSTMLLFSTIGWFLFVTYFFRIGRFFIGYAYIVWWCSAVAMLLAGVSERTVWVEKAWQPLGYMYIAVSGCFFLADWLPDTARRIALLQPSLQSYEMIRRGMFGNTVPTYSDFGYATFSLAVLTVLGLAITHIT
jgi:capsular polysaccharide transport system permease protein